MNTRRSMINTWRTRKTNNVLRISVFNRPSSSICNQISTRVNLRVHSQYGDLKPLYDYYRIQRTYEGKNTRTRQIVRKSLLHRISLKQKCLDMFFNLSRIALSFFPYFTSISRRKLLHYRPQNVSSEYNNERAKRTINVFNNFLRARVLGVAAREKK